ncbi:MAG TPA: M4 family metallopeptidase, partial [Pyrinomonadaceae bacterium]|nr:M4 family metallopeptidase [Pyrinomonadaceae bacterium]
RNRNFANGRIFEDARGVSTKPRITAAAALATAKKLLGREAGFERENVELVVLPEAVRLDTETFGATLTYKVELLINDGQEAARHFYFIDARSGALIWNYDGLETGLGHGLYAGAVGIGTVFESPLFRMRDPNRTNGVLCGVPGIITSDFPTTGHCTPYSDMDDIWGNSQPFNIQAAAVDAHYFSALTFDYFMGFHGRNSLDGNGRQMCNRMRNNSAGVNNAFWDGLCANFGQGSSGRHMAAVDVVGHEYTHAVTAFTDGPAFGNTQAGGSNESFSDIFGTMIEFFSGVSPDYTLGEDIAPPIRNMANPRSIPPSIDHFSQWFPGMDPHFSSGLQNIVFFLTAESGNHPTTGVFVKKIGRDRAASVFYRALDVYLTPTATFADVRQAVELATRDLYSTGNPMWNAVRKAWFSAGVGSDVPFNPIDTSSNFVAQHYRDFLLREGDAGGIAWWAGNIDQCGADAACEDGMRVNVSRAFWDSMDFQARPDVQASGLLTGNPAQPYNHHQFIRYCYLNYLGREPDPGGWAFWEAHLNSHGDYNALIRAFLCAGDYRSRFGPA